MNEQAYFEQFRGDTPKVKLTQSLISVGDRVKLDSDYGLSGLWFPIKGDHGTVKDKDDLYCEVIFDRFQDRTFTYHFLDLGKCTAS